MQTTFVLSLPSKKAKFEGAVKRFELSKDRLVHHHLFHEDQIDDDEVTR